MESEEKEMKRRKRNATYPITGNIQIETNAMRDYTKHIFDCEKAVDAEISPRGVLFFSSDAVS